MKIICSRKDSYEFDYCYDRDEGNGLIFSREVNPLIEDVFNGDNATVIAYGARGTGKTFIIQVSFNSCHFFPFDNFSWIVKKV